MEVLLRTVVGLLGEDFSTSPAEVWWGSIRFSQVSTVHFPHLARVQRGWSLCRTQALGARRNCEGRNSKQPSFAQTGTFLRVPRSTSDL